MNPCLIGVPLAVSQLCARTTIQRARVARRTVSRWRKIEHVLRSLPRSLRPVPDHRGKGQYKAESCQRREVMRQPQYLHAGPKCLKAIDMHITLLAQRVIGSIVPVALRHVRHHTVVNLETIESNIGWLVGCTSNTRWMRVRDMHGDASVRAYVCELHVVVWFAKEYIGL